MQGQLRATIMAENEIRQTRMVEEQIFPDFNIDQEPVFIADHLAFGCEEGVWLREIVTPFFKNRMIGRSHPFDKGTSYTVVPNSNILKQPEMTQATILDLLFDPERELIYVLWNTGKNNQAVLAQLDLKTGGVNAIFELPFIAHKGWLSWANFSKFEKKQRFLLLSVVDEQRNKSRLIAFEGCSIEKKLIPLWTKTEAELGIASTPAIGARLSNGQMMIMVIGKIMGANYLTAIPIMNNTDISEPRRFLLEGDDIGILMAVDLKQQGIADRLYYADQNCLWSLALDPKIFSTSEEIVSQHYNKKKWTGLKLNHAPLVVPDVSGRGVRLYITGEYLGKPGLFLIREGGEPQILLVQYGDYLRSFVRFGELWLIPKRATDEIILLQLPYHQRNLVRCESLFSVVSDQLLFDRAYVEIRWDPILEREMIMVLNNSYELTIFKASPFLCRYGLTGWQPNIVNNVDKVYE